MCNTEAQDTVSRTYAPKSRSTKDTSKVFSVAQVSVKSTYNAKSQSTTDTLGIFGSASYPISGISSKDIA